MEILLEQYYLLLDRVKNECRLYADDSKLIAVTEKEEGVIDIQKDIDNLKRMDEPLTDVI